jgi:peptidoglycan/xylan/chitin deacetylase (PgdA/CDA1 family)
MFCNSSDMPILYSVMILLMLMGAHGAKAGEVALTYDDLPVYGHFGSIEDATALTRKLLAGLTQHRYPAIGLVNEIQLDGTDKPARAALLARWLDAGMDLGNHGYSHLSLTDTPVDRYIADAACGEIVTKALLAARGRTEHWYRYPYLETGKTLAVRHTFETWLTNHGYRVAPVTIENSDWEFVDVYDDTLLSGDRPGAAKVRQAYLAFTAEIVPWYRNASIALFGREIRFIFLLHASRLNADSIDGLASILDREKLRAVTLERAMADPAYRLQDDSVGPDGDEWLTRWARMLHIDLPYQSLPDVPPDIAAAEARIAARPLAAQP